jgi:hypothetical protein
MFSQPQQGKRPRDNSFHDEPSLKREKESASRAMKKLIREAASGNGLEATARINRWSLIQEITGSIQDNDSSLHQFSDSKKKGIFFCYLLFKALDESAADNFWTRKTNNIAIRACFCPSIKGRGFIALYLH